MKILVISGTSVSAKAMELVLKSAGHTVARTDTVEDAAPDRSTPVDLVLLCPGHLQDLHGLEAQRRLRSVTPTPVVTVFDEPGLTEEERAVATTGGDMFLTAPVSRSELLETVERIAHNRGIPLYHVHQVIAAKDRNRLPRGSGYDRVGSVYKALK